MIFQPTPLDPTKFIWVTSNHPVEIDNMTSHSNLLFLKDL